MKNGSAKKLLQSLIGAVALTLALAGCGGGGGSTSGGTGGGGGGTTSTKTLVGISVSPANPGIKVGATQQFKATGTYYDTSTAVFSTADITTSVSWTSSTSSVATINSVGLASGVATGSVTIAATSGLVSGSTTLTVTNWTTHMNGPRSGLALNGIAYDGKNYVTVNGAVSTSTNLQVWNEQVGNASANDILWNGSMFVDAGFFGINSSPDGMVWTGRDGNTGTYTPTRLAYSSTLPMWVAVAPDITASQVYTSKDGLTWTMSALPTLPLNGNARSVTWTGTQFVAVGGLGTVLTSPDGLTWTVRNPGTTNNFMAVGSNGSLVVACTDAAGTNPGVYTSTDGITWGYAASSSSFANCSRILNNKQSGLWVMGGFDFAASSTNGTTWTKSASSVGQLYGLIFDGAQYVAAGGTLFGAPAIYSSPDGLTWSLKSTYEAIASIARNPSTGLLVALTNTDKSMASADNGVTWAYGGITVASTSGFFSDVTWSPGLSAFVANSGQGLYSSTDGLNWTQLGTYGNVCYGKVKASTTLLVTGCTVNSGSVYSSTNGVTWIKATTYPSTQGVIDVFWTGTQWVALGNGGDISTSPDALTWVLQASGTTQPLYGLASSPSIMVVVGAGGTVLTSTNNGVTWTPQANPSGSTPLNRVVWTGTQFVAVGSSGFEMTSTDGINWVAQPTPYTYTSVLFGSDPYNLNDILWTGTSLVMVGTRGLVATSP